MSDREVRARTADGGEIVRYDRASKWYVEYPAGSLKPRRHVKISEAARLAAAGTHTPSRHPTPFDKMVAKFRAEMES